jgi:hypothetical protein
MTRDLLLTLLAFSALWATRTTAHAQETITVCKTRNGVPPGYVIVGEANSMQCPHYASPFNAWTIRKSGDLAESRSLVEMHETLKERSVKTPGLEKAREKAPVQRVHLHTEAP